ncbi:MAG TPA: hypothetical protein VJ464_04690 [Blastocatellia bacterium]|nr:hypothetical protein [Blastocatellia bacterium]
MSNVLEIQTRDSDPESGLGLVADLIIDGRRLQDWVREIELPYTQSEGYADLAGSYESLPVEYFAPPSRHLFGEPSEAGALGKNRVLLLGCPCGIIVCWPLGARIAIEKDKVSWSEFYQPYRNEEMEGTTAKYWKYEGFKFTFELGPYEKVWRKITYASRA